MGNVVVMTNYNNTARIVIESLSKRVLSGSNYTTRLPMASTTKVMTAYLAVLSGKLDEIVTIHSKAVGVEGSSIYLKEGEKITLRDLTYGLMLRSGNDSAVAIAFFLGGSVEGFSRMMNDKAVELGCLDSNFVNPHGLHDDNHYTTALDLAVITASALSLDEFSEIVSSKSRTIKSSTGEERHIANKNKMLALYNGASGVKTGYTKMAGRCLVSSAKRDGVELVSVVLNVSDMWNVSMSTMDEGFRRCISVPILTKDDMLDNVKHSGYEGNIRVAATDSYSHTFIEGDPIDVTWKIKYKDNLPNNIKSGDIVGSIELFNQNHLIFESKICSIDNVIKKEKTSRFRRSDMNGSIMQTK